MAMPSESELLKAWNIANSTDNQNQTLDNLNTWSIAMHIFFYLDYSIIGIGLVFNIFGIILLIRAKRRVLQNQSIFLIHLSLVAIICLLANGVAIYFKASRILFPKWYIIAFYVSYIAYITNLVFLTLDRLIFIVFYSKYHQLITRMRAIVLLFMIWIMAISYGLAIQYGNLTKLRGYTIYSSYVYNGFVVVVSTVVYVAISVKVYQTSLRVGTATKVLHKKKYLIPLFIVISFFISEVFPSIIVHVVKVLKSDFNLMIVVLIGVNVFTYICDPIIYVFVQPKVRKIMFSSLRKIAQGNVSPPIDNIRTLQRKRIHLRYQSYENKAYSTSH